MTFKQWNARACKLANALLDLGLKKGDRVALLAYNRVEWMELYIALAKAGLVAVPINFRLVTPEIQYIAEHCEAKAHHRRRTSWSPQVETSARRARDRRQGMDPHRRHDARGLDGLRSARRGAARRASPASRSIPTDTWALMYTSGTTGKPKGAIRNHEGMALMSLVTALDMGLTRDDTALLVMPMCHANSLNFGSHLHLYRRHRRRRRPQELRSGGAAGDDGHRSTSRSPRSCPTHYIMTLGLPAEVKASYDVSRVRKLMISLGAGAQGHEARDPRLLQELAALRAVRLERGGLGDAAASRRADRSSGFGRPRMDRVGTREDARPARQRGARRRGRRALLVHAVYLRRLPQRSGEDRGSDAPRRLLQRRRHGAPRRAWLHPPRRPQEQHDHQRRREHLPERDREHPRPLSRASRTSRVVGVPHEKWGEAVHAVIVMHAGQTAAAEDMLEWCRDKMAGYKRPRSVSFMAEADMPRTATGKILHRVLRDKLAGKG